MQISGVGNSFHSYQTLKAVQQNQVEAQQVAAKTQAAQADPDHDGDVDPVGQSDNDGTGRVLNIRL